MVLAKAIKRGPSGHPIDPLQLDTLLKKTLRAAPCERQCNSAALRRWCVDAQEEGAGCVFGRIAQSKEKTKPTVFGGDLNVVRAHLGQACHACSLVAWTCGLSRTRCVHPGESSAVKRSSGCGSASMYAMALLCRVEDWQSRKTAGVTGLGADKFTVRPS
jgi:hypothetical protein